MKTLGMKACAALLMATCLSGASVALAQHAGATSPRGSAPARFGRDDLDADGRVTLAEARAAALALFVRFDANGDGRVTRDEVNERAHRWRLERAAVRFQSLDRDRDGHLSPSELGSRRRFAYLDRDADGRLSPAELARDGEPGRCGGGEEASLRSSLWRRDLDRDGSITRLEMLRAAERRFARKDRNRDGVSTRDEIGQPRR